VLFGVTLVLSLFEHLKLGSKRGYNDPRRRCFGGLLRVLMGANGYGGYIVPMVRTYKWPCKGPGESWNEYLS
jgi:hypothetical protein